MRTRIPLRLRHFVPAIVVWALFLLIISPALTRSWSQESIRIPITGPAILTIDFEALTPPPDPTPDEGEGAGETLRTLLWNADSEARLKNPQIAEIVPGGVVGNAVRGTWTDGKRNPSLNYNHGGPGEDPQFAGHETLEFWIRVEGDPGTLGIRLSSWDKPGGESFGWLVLDDISPFVKLSTTWTLARIPLSAIQWDGTGLEPYSSDHFVPRVDPRPNPDVAVYFDEIYMTGGTPPEPDPTPDEGAGETELSRLPGIQRIAVLDATHLAIGTLREPGPVTVNGEAADVLATHRVLIGESPDEKWFAGYWTYITSSRRGLGPLSVSADTGGAASFIFDEDTTISHSIKVNQLGYLPGAPKVAYLGAEIPEVGPLEFDVTTFDVVRDGQAVFTGPVVRTGDVVVNQNGEALSGEVVYELDFTAFNTPGTYYLRIAGVGRSPEIRVAADAWGDLFFHATRFLYHQRNGLELTAAYTKFPRASNGVRPLIRGQMPPRVLKNGPKSIGSTFDANAWSMAQGADPILPAWTYGWRNAADEDDIATLHISNVFDILWNYDLHPEHFTDGQLNIPESGNGVPDILDEALYFMEGYRILQGAIGTGEVPGWINNDRQRFQEDETKPWVCASPDRASTLVFAAAFAKMAVTLDGTWHSTAAEYRQAAIDAYAWGAAAANNATARTIHAIANRGRGDEYVFEMTQAQADDRNTQLDHYLVMAKTALHRLTGDRAYLVGLDALTLPKPGYSPFRMKDYSVHFYWDLVHLDGFREQAQTLYLDTGDQLVARLDDGDYRTSKALKDRSLGFGNSKTMGEARFLAFCYELTKDERYRDAMIPNIDFVLGANPMGLSWVTYCGYAWPQRIQIGETPLYPGVSVYGPWETYGKDAAGRKMVAAGILADRPLYKRWAAHPRFLTTGDEYELNDSTAVFCGLYFLPEGWMPSAALKATKPVGMFEQPGEFYLP